jgi:hypothetical protein
LAFQNLKCLQVKKHKYDQEGVMLLRKEGEIICKKVITTLVKA